MKRKLFRIGGSVAVTLPYGWVALKDWKPGDEVEFEERDGGLLIRKKEGGNNESDRRDQELHT